VLLFVCVCSVVGLVVTCACVFLAYRYIVSSSGDTELDSREQKKEKMSAKKGADSGENPGADSGENPASELSKTDDVSVKENTATFTVDGEVSFVLEMFFFFSVRLKSVSQTV